MEFKIYDLLHSQFSHRYVSAGIPVICRAMLLLQEYERTILVSCITFTP